MPIVTFSSLGRYGRLCNGAYQICSTIGIARRNGYDFGFPLWRNYDGLNFESNIDIDIHEHFLNPLPLYEGPSLPDRFVHWGYHAITLTESCSLSGHMQSSRYFEHCMDEIRFYMRMVNEPPMNDYAAIHVRRTDYMEGDESYHPRLDLRYYEPALAHFGSDQQFLVFSDDIPGAKELFRPLEGKHRIEYSQEPDYIADFRRLKTCAHFVIANSSFSSMAAILGDNPSKQIIAPMPWFGPIAGINAEDLYEPSWTVLNWA